MTASRPAAEQIAEVVADIRAGRVHHPAAFDEQGIIHSLQLLQRAQQPQPVVDCTAIFGLQLAAHAVDPYDDHPQIVPPWADATFGYVNTFGNVVVMQCHRRDHAGSVMSRDDWFTENEVDWSQVRWIAETSIWVGGVAGDGRTVPTSGPCHLFRHAIHGDGSPADINWVALMVRRGRSGGRDEIGDQHRATWEAAGITLGASLNFLSASNVDVAEPSRPRPERRRLARTGVTVQTIVVRQPGKRRARSGAARPIDASESVLSPVRGHWARYGPEHGRGLLFGRYAGKFWIPSHVRGEGEAGQRDYVLRPGRVAS